MLSSTKTWSGTTADARRLGIPRADGSRANVDPRAAWRVFARHFHLFRGTPSSMWLNHVFYEVFGLRQRLDESTADTYYDRITDALQTPQFKEEAQLLRELGGTKLMAQSPVWPVLGPPQGVWDDIWPLGETAVHPPVYRPSAPSAP